MSLSAVFFPFEDDLTVPFFDELAVFVDNEGMGNAARIAVTGQFEVGVVIRRSAGERGFVLLEIGLAGRAGFVVPDEDELDVGLFEFFVLFDDLGHECAAGRTPTAGVQEDVVVGLESGLALKELNLLKRVGHGCLGAFICCGTCRCFGVLTPVHDDAAVTGCHEGAVSLVDAGEGDAGNFKALSACDMQGAVAVCFCDMLQGRQIFRIQMNLKLWI